MNRINQLVTALLCFAIPSMVVAQKDKVAPTLARNTDLKASFTYSGNQTLHGTKQQFELHMDKNFRFRARTNGPLPEMDGFDGKILWHLNGSGVPRISSYSDRDLTRIVAYVQSGVWSCKNSPIQVVSDKGNSLVIKCDDGPTTANLTLNPETHTAKVLSCWGSSGKETWTFSNYVEKFGVSIPTVVDHESGESKDITTVSVSSLVAFDSLNFSMPPASTTGYAFDTSASKNIEVKRLFGYLFVKPKLDGKDEGWWFLDTGAEIMVIDPAVARSHNMKIVGKESVSGVVASVTSNFSIGVEFGLGPVSIKNSSYMELDMKPFGDALGIKLSGICGYDFISRVSLDIDPKLPTIGVHSPGTGILPDGATWIPFLFHGNIPALNCTFEGNRDGLFSLDSGSGSTIDFFSPTVAKHNLLKDRKVESVMTGGAGGASESKTGIMDWFTLGTKRFEKPKVGFQITEKGGFASPYVDGNIGMGLLGKFRMILDYQNSRLALIESK